MQSIPADTGIVIVDHGSKRAAANDMLLAVAALYREESCAEIVEAAHMELAEPSIAQAFARCVERGAKAVVIHPYFLSPGRHSTSDIPALCAEAAAAFPEIPYAVTEPLGLDRRMAQVMHDRIVAALPALAGH